MPGPGRAYPGGLGPEGCEGYGGPMAKFGPYKIKKLLANHAGYVSVFKAQDAEGVGVLLRVLNTAVDPGGAAYQRFQQEFRTLEKLFHPNILPVLDAGQIEGKAYYAAPVRPTLRPLSDFLTGGLVEFEWRDAVDIGAQVLDALDHMHASGVLHRDLRTTSVYYDMDSAQAVIAEFGMVKNFELPNLTMQGVAKVSVPIVTPESARDQPATARTDLYLLGNLVYEILAGESGVRYDFAYVPLLDRGVDAPAALDTLLAKVLAEDPAARPASCAELKAALVALRADP